MLLLWSSACVAAADGAPPTPLSLLEGQQLISSPSFILSHATYAQYRFHWVRPSADMTALFGTDAQTRAQATQVRWIDLTVSLTRAGRLTSAAERALIQASEALAAGCFKTSVIGLKAQVAQTLAKAERVRIVELSFGPNLKIDVIPSDAVPRRELTVQLHLPAGKSPLCRTVPE